MQRNPNVEPLFFLGLALALAGCLSQLEDPGGAMPLQVANELDRTVEIHIEIREPYGQSVLFESSALVASDAQQTFETPRLPFGRYVVTASNGALEREVEADFEPSTRFQRFVVHSDVIAFQSG